MDKNIIINKRIKKDIKTLEEKNMLFTILDANSIEVNLTGPDKTPYKYGIWTIKIMYPIEYPFKSPSVGFLNKIYHPNVDLNSGSICLNVLNTNWSPIYTTMHILDTFLPQLLTYPNPDDPLNQDAANMLNMDKDSYNKFVSKFISFNNWKNSNVKI